jgi:hypothetical protein
MVQMKGLTRVVDCMRAAHRVKSESRFRVQIGRQARSGLRLRLRMHKQGAHVLAHDPQTSSTGITQCTRTAALGSLPSARAGARLVV